MASHFLQLNDRISQGEGDPADGDALCTSLSLFPVGAIYINNDTGKLFARNAADGVAADWVSQSGGEGGDSLFPTTGTGTATGAVIGELAGFDLSVQTAGFIPLYLSISESQILSYNSTGDGNQARYSAATSATDATSRFDANFNDGVKLARIDAFADASASSITHTADSHIFIGVQEFADNAAAITGGLATGAIYRTGDALKIVH